MPQSMKNSQDQCSHEGSVLLLQTRQGKAAPSGLFAEARKDDPKRGCGQIEREFEILELVARGQNNKEISNRLSLSVKTVQNYVSSILTKLQVADRLQAMLRAKEAGMGEKPKND